MTAHSNAPVIIKRKKVVQGDGHHGGAWKVAYADFVTAMMAFFMLMWLLNATTEKQRKGLADYFSPTIPVNRISGGGDGAFGGDSIFSEQVMAQNGIGATMKHATRADKARGETGVDADGAAHSAMDALRSLEEQLMGRGGESLVSDEMLRHVVTRVTDEGLVIELFAREGAPLFAAGGTEPTALMLALTEMLVEVIGLVENGIAIEGHSRSHAIVLAKSPVWDLSTARADRTRGMLQEAGLDQDRLRRVTGHADRAPAVANPMAMRNDRIEVILLRSDMP